MNTQEIRIKNIDGKEGVEIVIYGFLNNEQFICAEHFSDKKLEDGVTKDEINTILQEVQKYDKRRKL